MDKKIIERFDGLLNQGKALVDSLPPLTLPIDQHGGKKTIPGRVAPYIDEFEIPKYQSWLDSTANLIHQVADSESHFTKEYVRSCLTLTEWKAASLHG